MMNFLNKKIRKLEKKIFTQTPRTLLKKKNVERKYKNIMLNKDINLKQYNFGNLNSDKTFYVIRRSPGAGIFSNLIYVLNHLKIAYENNYIPFVDMENYPTIYNEKFIVNKTTNSWEYFFKNLSNYKSYEIYKSKNVIITENNFFDFFQKWMSEDNRIVEILKDKIELNDNIYFIFNFLKNKLFKKKKILGVHFRGTSYKTSPGHPFPATKNQMLYLVNQILKNEKIDKIFLSTEEKNYLDFFIEKFPEKIIFLPSAYRSNKNDAFIKYPRQKHRYKLGREILLETLLLSSSDYFIYTRSNVSEFALSMQLNHRQIRYKIDNGENSPSKFKSLWIWYLKSILPDYLGGFKNKTV